MRVLTIVSGPAQGSGVRTASAGVGSVLESLGHEQVTLCINTARRREGNRLNVENVSSAVRDVLHVAVAVRRHRPTIVWFHSLGFPMLPAVRTFVIVLTVRLCRVPVVTHLHAYGLDEGTLAPQRWTRCVIWAFGRLSARVVALHSASARAIGSVVPPERVSVLPNVVAVPATPTPLPGGDRKRLVFVGGIVRRKGVPQLLEAMRLLDGSYELHLVGGAGEDGPGATERLMDDAADLVASGRVVFEGELGDDGVRHQLRQSNLFVLPSDAEGTPVALLEAMAEGRPVLVTDVGDMAEIVRAAQCGRVLESREPSVLAAAISDLMSADFFARAASGARAHRAVARGYSPAAVGSAVRELLHLVRT